MKLLTFKTVANQEGEGRDSKGQPRNSNAVLGQGPSSALRDTYNSIFELSVGFPDSSVGKESTCNAGDLGWIPGLGRSPGEGKGYPLQYSGLENFIDCIVHGIAKSQTRLSDFYFTSLELSIELKSPTNGRC